MSRVLFTLSSIPGKIGLTGKRAEECHERLRKVKACIVSGLIAGTSEPVNLVETKRTDARKLGALQVLKPNESVPLDEIHRVLDSFDEIKKFFADLILEERKVARSQANNHNPSPGGKKRQKTKPAPRRRTLPKGIPAR